MAGAVLCAPRTNAAPTSRPAGTDSSAKTAPIAPELEHFDPAAAYADAASQAILPPPLPWSGKSRELALPPDSKDPWLTPCERSGLTATPRYDETVAWLARLANASGQVEMVSLGRSDEGRDIWMLVASATGAVTPERLRASGKPTVLVQAGIHAGEIDGKDAGMMLLRDMTVRGTQKELLARVNLLFVPIFNVDGHERFSKTARVNQRGPVEQGWRTNARNLNLNRDYTKLDSPEMRAMVRALNLWQPDLYVDVHVTDGVDCQYDVTWGAVGSHGYSPSCDQWLRDRLDPAATARLQEMGHAPGPLLFAADDKDMSKGIVQWTASARFSNGYGDLRHLPTVLEENHSLKPYDQRVLGTYVFLQSVLRTVGEHGQELRRAIDQDRGRRPRVLPLSWRVADGPPPRMSLLSVESRVDSSAVTGGPSVRWLGRPVTLDVPVLAFVQAETTAQVPRAYLIPPSWGDVAARVELHGIRTERFSRPRDLDVDMFRMVDVKLEPSPYEGHVRVAATPVRERRHERFAAGTVRVPTDQPLGELAVVLLDPSADDSFFKWGFFLEALQQTEYVEDYVMEPMAQRMLDADPQLRAQFEQRLRDDAKFAADPRERLAWFYRRTPYFDDRWSLYPVALEP